jgi:6-phosphogluconolactonase/glucosamine-6-phosphate isomerase/deaminase
MFTDYLNKYSIRYHLNQGITVSNVKDQEEGVELAKGIMYEIVDKNSVLYLSGGRMQRLYELFAKEETILPGAVGLIDERYGEPMWENSNEKMINDTKFLKYLAFNNVPFYPIIQKGKKREEAAYAYDEKVRSLHATFQKHIGIIGIGPDGHTSSIIPNRSDFHNPWFDADHQHLLVSELNDPNSHYKERVGMTFLGLSMLDQLLILAFGDSKQPMFELMFAEGKEKEIPARFFKRSEIAVKTLLITDQIV